MASSSAAPKRKKKDPTAGLLLILLVAFLGACALLWFGFQRLKRSADPYGSMWFPPGVDGSPCVMPTCPDGRNPGWSAPPSANAENVDAHDDALPWRRGYRQMGVLD